MLKCQGCGQVGTIAGNPVDARQRRHGFYLHDEPNGSQVVACCKCQQIQARASE